MLRMFAGNGRAVLIARLSTLYGRGQSRHKTQGLITHLARGIARNQVTQVYVPLDTIRDYIAADDAASEIVTSLRFPDMASKCTVKIIASEQATTIAQIVAVLKMIARRSPRIVTSSNNLGSLYSRRIRFHSVVEPCRKGPPATSLLVGIAQLLALERKAFARTSFRKRQEPGHQ